MASAVSRRVLAFLAIALLLLFVLLRSTKGGFSVFSLFSDGETEVVLDERFDIRGVDDLSIDIQYLNVDIISTPDEQVRVVLESNLARENCAEVAVERDGNKFKVEQLHRVRFGIFLGVRERLTVYLPAAYADALSLRLRSGNLNMLDARRLSDIAVHVTSGNLEIGDLSCPNYAVQTTSGNVTLGNWNGEGKLQLASGTLRIQALTGEKHAIRAASGAIRIGALRGNVNLDITSGTVKIESFAGQGSLSSSSGGVNVDIERLTGDLRLHCTSGTIKATLPESASFFFEGKSLSGGIKTDFATNKDGRRHTATVGNEAQYKLNCDTTSGSIRVSYR